MESIYKTKTGKYVDLSKVVAISEVEFMGGNGYGFSVYFQLCEKPVQFIYYFESMKQENIDCREELIINWKAFKGEITLL